MIQKATIYFIWLILLSYSHITKAQPCESASAKIGHPDTYTTVTLMQHTFDNGQTDLALLVLEPNKTLEVKRITYSGITSDSCRYFPVQIVKGGEWGWHMLWRESGGVFYSRMDGEAWVSTPPKQLVEVEVNEAKMLVNGEEITVYWKQAEVEWQKQSLTEGQTWRESRPVPSSKR